MYTISKMGKTDEPYDIISGNKEWDGELFVDGNRVAVCSIHASYSGIIQSGVVKKDPILILLSLRGKSAEALFSLTHSCGYGHPECNSCLPYLKPRTAFPMKVYTQEGELLCEGIGGIYETQINGKGFTVLVELKPINSTCVIMDWFGSNGKS